MSVIRLAGALAVTVVLLVLPALMVVVSRSLPNTSGGAWLLVVAGSALLGAPGAFGLSRLVATRAPAAHETR